MLLVVPKIAGSLQATTIRLLLKRSSTLVMAVKLPPPNIALAVESKKGLNKYIGPVRRQLKAASMLSYPFRTTWG